MGLNMKKQDTYSTLIEIRNMFQDMLSDSKDDRLMSGRLRTALFITNKMIQAKQMGAKIVERAGKSR